MFFKDGIFFQKNFEKKHMFFVVDKTKQKLLFENYECFSKQEKKCQDLIFAEDTYQGPYGYRYSPYEPGFDQSI